MYPIYIRTYGYVLKSTSFVVNDMHFFADPPTITKFPEVGPFRAGDPLHVFCSASGIPSPTIQLFINDEEILVFHGALSVTHNVTSTTIRNDHGTYKCVASSNSRATGQPFPTASKSIEVIVQG